MTGLSSFARRAVLPLFAVALAACQPAVPASNSGIGFGDPAEFARQQAARDAQLAGSGNTNFAVAPAGQPRAISTEELASAGIGLQQPVGPVSTVPAAPVGAPLSAISPQTPASDNPSISDEQDFGAVSARETIQSDAARRAQQAAQRQVVQPTALPDRPADTGPNIVAYALTAPNVKGQEWYSRSLLSGQGRFQRNCASYQSADAAQRDFLARGGPNRDPRGIDPDGDGFACGWDPAPFRLAAGQ